MKWFQALWKREALKPLERRLLEVLEQAMEPPASSLLREQVARINLVQRHSKGREVCCYSMRGGRPHRDERTRFPARQTELAFATVKFEVPDIGVFEAVFHSVEGYFFSIDFTPSPERVIERSDPTILSAVIQADPGIAEATSRPRPCRSDIVLRGWLAEKETADGVSDLRAPLPEQDRRLRIAKIEAVLPAEYLAAIEVADGFRIRDVTVLGLGEVRPVVLEDATYYLLAEVGDEGMLGVRRHDDDGVLFALPLDDSPRPIVASFREATGAARSRLFGLGSKA